MTGTQKVDYGLFWVYHLSPVKLDIFLCRQGIPYFLLKTLKMKNQTIYLAF